MIWILRNISIHIWITTLFAVPFCFFLLTSLAKFFPGINPIITGALTFPGILVTIGFLMDITAKKIVTGLIKEGQAWERSGIFNKAQKNYIKALRIYDTFLLWPFSAGKTAKKLSGAIAEFKLNTGVENQNFKLATAVYLKMNPEDVDIAGLWLKQIRQSTMVTPIEQEVLSLLAERYYADESLLILMADIFLGLERKDFTAKKLYHHVQKLPQLEKAYSEKIESIIGKPEKTIQQEVFFFQPERKPRRKIKIGKNIQDILFKCLYYLKSSWLYLGRFLSFIFLSAGKIYTYIKEHEKAQLYLKAGLLCIISVWLGFFVINTMSHLFQPTAIEKEKAKIEIQISKRFTIQVAAYLKKTYADRYVDILKKKGIDAIVKKVAGGGKTWFVVRVSQFADKKSATDYGRKLKRQKIIDDFFVNNK
ncbi:MAG: SPOR domain-containing protein [Deltaproteobacteria bacterium]|nr:SPOR domain-containing protein [Deltaproteobacteria bacterium]